MSRDEVIRRWRANTGAAGVRLSDSDVERITSSGAIDRVLAVEDIVVRAEARKLLPDYLSLLSAPSNGGTA